MGGQEWRDRVVLAITGASGVVYGYELLRSLVSAGKKVSLITSENGSKLISLELGLDLSHLESIADRTYRNDEMDSDLASGSTRFQAMVIAPCSMRTLGCIASGISENLICRVAEVCLKERRRLIVVPRETPLSLIHIENMRRLALSGGIVLPAMPAFYYKPKTVDEIVGYVVGKVLDQLGIDHELFPRWKGTRHR